MSSKPTVFARTASGLRREWSIKDAWVFNFLVYSGISSGFLFLTLIVVPAFYPGYNLILGAVIAYVLTLPTLVCYAIMGSSYPRGGGDYVYNSRILSPVVGFVVANTLALSTIGWMVYHGLTDAGNFWGALFWLGGLPNVASWIQSSAGALLVVLIFVVIPIIIVSSGMRWVARWLWIAFALQILSWVILIGTALLVSNQQVISSFNAFVDPRLHVNNSYQQIIDLATKKGYTSAPFNWGSTLAVAAFLLNGVGWAGQSVIQSGEIKEAHKLKSRLWEMVGAATAAEALVLIIFAVIPPKIGTDFIGAWSYLFLIGQGYGTVAPPIWPFFAWPLIMSLGGFFLIASIILWVAVGISSIYYNIVNAILPIKYVFAEAFDGLLPQKLAYIHPRTRAPIIAAVCILAAALIWTAFAVLNPRYYIFTLLVANAIIAIIWNMATDFSALLSHWRAKNVMELSPAGKYKIGGLPVASIMGALGVLGSVIFLWIYLAFPALGITPGSLVIVGELYVLVGVVFIIMWAVRKSQGRNIFLAFKEIPPE